MYGISHAKPSGAKQPSQENKISKQDDGSGHSHPQKPYLGAFLMFPTRMLIQSQQGIQPAGGLKPSLNNPQGITTPRMAGITHTDLSTNCQVYHLNYGSFMVLYHL